MYLFVHFIAIYTRELFLARFDYQRVIPFSLDCPASPRLKELGGSESAGMLESVLKTVGKATDQAIQRHGNLVFTQYGAFFRYFNTKDQIRSELS